jgi:hypothetical protein
MYTQNWSPLLRPDACESSCVHNPLAFTGSIAVTKLLTAEPGGLAALGEPGGASLADAPGSLSNSNEN